MFFFEDNAPMEKTTENTWRDRLKQSLADRGLSMREVSLGAGLGPGSVNSWFKENKDPSISNLMAVCAFAKISLSYVTHGFEVSAETAEVLRLLEQNPARREGILQILQAK
jgi:transcriptional regulator with XRE-family HTH domain